MTKINYMLIVMMTLLTPIISNAQYKMQSAFPNLAAFNNPIEMVHAYDGTNRLFVVQQRGLIYVFDNSPAVSARKTFINLSSRVSQSGSELGLLGLAFHPEYENNRYLYVDYTFDSVVGGSTTYWSRISRYTASESNPDTALLSTESILFTLRQPYSNHNGGKIAFGADGYLYVSLGDGGSGGDPLGNGQNLATLLGSILRINIDSAGGGRQYSIPATNPFYGNINGYKEEIYAYGLRNPWKFSFDFTAGRLWAGDVGQNLYEEIDIIESGLNYGWNKMEGFHGYNGYDTSLGVGLIRPVYEYSHSLGNSITGGYVYRGPTLPGLTGKYVYADYGAGTVWALTYDGINPTVNALLQDSNFLISSFGVDMNNELYVVRYSSTAGRIYKFVNTSVAILNLKMAIEGLYNADAGRLNLSDTVRVYIRQTASPFNLVDSAVTVIDSLSLSGLCFLSNTPTGTYYLQIKHRNGLETWSKAGGTGIVRGGTSSYDFTSAQSQAYQSNQILKGTVYCFYSGDIFKDGVIELDDILDIYNNSSAFSTGYLPVDINGDSVVDLDDILIVFNNSNSFVSLKRP